MVDIDLPFPLLYMLTQGAFEAVQQFRASAVESRSHGSPETDF